MARATFRIRGGSRHASHAVGQLVHALRSGIGTALERTRTSSQWHRRPCLERRPIIESPDDT